jgi:hypothetical protein
MLLSIKLYLIQNDILHCGVFYLGLIDGRQRLLIHIQYKRSWCILSKMLSFSDLTLQLQMYNNLTKEKKPAIQLAVGKLKVLGIRSGKNAPWSRATLPDGAAILEGLLKEDVVWKSCYRFDASSYRGKRSEPRCSGLNPSGWSQ